MRCAGSTLLLLVGMSVCGCGKPADSTPPKAPPAHVARHVEEPSLNTITLTEQAQQRLGIQLAEVRLVNVQRQRTFGGDVTTPPGNTIIMSAPLAGTLSAPESGPVPAPGNRLAAGQPVFRFQPLLTPERDVLTPAERVSVAQTRADLATAQMEAERQVESAKINVEAAQLAYDRAAQMLEIKAGSQRSVEEAEAQLKLARQAQLIAETRFAFLSEISLDEHAGELATLTIASPVAGVLQRVEVAAGETVATGQALFHVVNMDRMWVRVPVYVGNFRGIDTAAGASIAEYGARPGDPGRPAGYVSAPPSANPMATTVDLFYELANDDQLLYPGQKVAVTLPMQARRKSLVVPFQAVLYDIHGGAWVYEQVAPLSYARRRIAVEYTDQGNAVLAAGPEPGARVVTDGAAELFGTEFGVGH